MHGPIVQDPNYHRFADTRTLLGIPNFWNVVSNLPFLAIGIWGLYRLQHGPAPGVLAPLRSAYAVFFAGSALIAAGSAYYHLAPGDARLVWDRLPMTLSFMAFFAAVLGEHLSPGLGRRALLPLLAAGAASVGWWASGGDLRAYVIVQFLPALMLPAMLLLMRSRLTGPIWLWGVFGAYALAKLLELADAPLLQMLGIGGHALKHLAAAMAIGCMVPALRRRRPI